MTVQFEMRDTIAVLTLADPAHRNALSRAIVRGMFEALAQARAARARAIVIAAQGRVFCAGANIDDLRDGWMEGKEAETDPVGLFRALAEEPRIVIAAVQGPAVGGGFELTLSCDLVAASAGAWFSLPELGHGVIPNTGLARLTPVIGLRRAMELVTTRRRVSAEEALELGLVNRLTAHEDPLQEGLQLAAQIIGQVPPGALAAAKRNLHRHAMTDWQRVQSSLLEVPAPEWEEGLRSFTERRAPDYEKFWRTA